MIHIKLDWDERDVIAAISLLGLIIAETGKPKDKLSGYDELAATAHWMADAFQTFDAHLKSREMLRRRFERDELSQEQYDREVEDLEKYYQRSKR